MAATTDDLMAVLQQIAAALKALCRIHAAGGLAVLDSATKAKIDQANADLKNL